MNIANHPRNKTYTALKYLRTSVLAISILLTSDSLGLIFALGSIPKSTLVLIIFLEGGFGLIAGVGISLSSTPSIAKLGEMLFGTASWSREAEKHAERVGWRWLLTSFFLILIGFVLSAT